MRRVEYIIYNLSVEPTGTPNRFHITWENRESETIDSFEQEINLTPEEVQWLWQMPYHRKLIGEKLFRFLDGKGHCFRQALDHAYRKGNSLLIYLHTCTEAANWPFEVLRHKETFLLHRDLHLLRRFPGESRVKAMPPAKRPLKLLFMACSVQDVQKELDFEKEEEAIFAITETLPIEMVVEDSGTLPGLRKKLEHEVFDVVHLSGQAGFDKKGKPYFVMEDDMGGEHRVSPDRLWAEALCEKPPRLVVLSAGHTGETANLADTPVNEAEGSFAEQLVKNYNAPAVLGWGRKVNDRQAITAGKVLFRELSRGETLPDALQRARLELAAVFPGNEKPAWPLLRLYATGVPLEAVVEKEQQWKPKSRRMKHVYLKNSRVKILEEGFVGRRRQLQRSLRGLNASPGKVGVLILGTGGLGKSCLAGKICERFPGHTLIIIQGRLNTIAMEKALRYAFVKNQDDNGKRILSQAIKMKDKLVHLCSASFKERNYLFVLDDFEQNLEGYEKGEPGPLLPEAAELLRVLLHYLPLSEKKSQLLITSRYEFSHSHEEQNPVDERLEKIWLTGFRKAEQSKKLRELPNIFVCKDPVLAKQLLEAGHGNPRLMEWIDLLAAQLKAKEMKELAAEIADRQQDFIHEHVIRELLKKGGVKLGLFLRLFSIYRIPVLEEGVKSVAEQGGVKDWQKLLRKGMALSLAEHDQARDSYQVTPLLREEFFKKLEGYLLPCHEAAFAYFKKLCELRKSLDPVLTEEWIYHALGCGKEDVASRQGGQLVNHLREHLAFPESRRIGEWILCIKKQELSTEHDAILINELGNTIHKMGDHLKALTHYQQALDIWRKIFGEQHHYIAIAMNSLASAWIDSDEPNKAIEYLEKALEIDRVGLNPQHPNLAIYLNNLGEIFRVLGKPTKAIEYFQQALAIWKKTYGEMHPRVATAMNNLGMTWDYLGKSQMATEYLKKALNIHITILGMHHPNVALGFNNLGVIWNSLGNYHETIGFFQQALNIWIKIYGKIHPQVAATINNIGSVLENLGEPHKAIEYYQEALEIDKIVFGSLHQAVARELNNLGGAWETLGEPRKAIYYYQQSIDILKKVYSEKHPQVATAINNLGEAWKLFGKPRKAVKYFQQALEIDEAIFGRQHPNVATRLNNLGEAYRVLGKPRQAIAYYQQALDIVTKAYGEMHPYVAATTNNIGSAYFDLGEMDRAKVYFERSYTIKLKIFGPDHPRSKLTAECLDECCKKEP